MKSSPAAEAAFPDSHDRQTGTPVRTLGCHACDLKSKATLSISAHPHKPKCSRA